ncbi:hypothetical protein ACFO5X_10235 [Seohaeicola nanhaiensis]|uniref:Uncharacterized protein n=1 Tax=Seohaeicola nanhaiensis TaxID=1387282 RepID=A0ABV9KFR9_9RHOB
MAVRILGWDLNVAFRLGDAMGIDPFAIAELLPDIEAVAVYHMNKRAPSSDDA